MLIVLFGISWVCVLILSFVLIAFDKKPQYFTIYEYFVESFVVAITLSILVLGRAVGIPL